MPPSSRTRVGARTQRRWRPRSGWHVALGRPGSLRATLRTRPRAPPRDRRDRGRSLGSRRSSRPSRAIPESHAAGSAQLRECIPAAALRRLGSLASELSAARTMVSTDVVVREAIAIHVVGRPSRANEIQEPWCGARARQRPATSREAMHVAERRAFEHERQLDRMTAPIARARQGRPCEEIEVGVLR